MPGSFGFPASSIYVDNNLEVLNMVHQWWYSKIGVNKSLLDLLPICFSGLLYPVVAV